MLPKSNGTTYEAARQQGQEILRRSVIDAAKRLLVQSGPEALKVRNIAAELGCSTKVIYTMFGDKDGLANALYAEGIEILRTALEQVPVTTDPVEYLNNVGWGYWNFALKYPDYYRVMFGNAIPGFTPNRPNIELTDTAFAMMVREIGRFMETGSIVAADAYVTAKALWAILHGVVILNLDHYFDDMPGVNIKVLELNLKMITNELTGRK